VNPRCCMEDIFRGEFFSARIGGTASSSGPKREKTSIARSDNKFSRTAPTSRRSPDCGALGWTEKYLCRVRGEEVSRRGLCTTSVHPLGSGQREGLQKLQAACIASRRKGVKIPPFFVDFFFSLPSTLRRYNRAGYQCLRCSGCFARPCDETSSWNPRKDYS